MSNLKKISLILVANIFLTVGAISAEKNEISLGIDKDIHGCIGTAGYKWCLKTNKCERPWELAKKEKFEKNVEAFNEFCKNKESKK